MNPQASRKQMQTFNTAVLVTMLFGGIILGITFSFWWLTAFNFIAGAMAYGIWFGRYRLLKLVDLKWNLADTAMVVGFLMMGFFGLAVITFED